MTKPTFENRWTIASILTLIGMLAIASGSLWGAINHSRNADKHVNPATSVSKDDFIELRREMNEGFSELRRTQDAHFMQFQERMDAFYLQ